MVTGFHAGESDAKIIVKIADKLRKPNSFFWPGSALAFYRQAKSPFSDRFKSPGIAPVLKTMRDHDATLKRPRLKVRGNNDEVVFEVPAGRAESFVESLRRKILVSSARLS